MAQCSGNVQMKEQCENHEKCMKMIQAVLDGSATEDEVDHFKSNMESCLPCIEGYELEKIYQRKFEIESRENMLPSKNSRATKSKDRHRNAFIGGFMHQNQNYSSDIFIIK